MNPISFTIKIIFLVKKQKGMLNKLGDFCLEHSFDEYVLLINCSNYPVKSQYFIVIYLGRLFDTVGNTGKQTFIAHYSPLV